MSTKFWKINVGERHSVEKKQNCLICTRKLQQWSRSNWPFLLKTTPKTRAFLRVITHGISVYSPPSYGWLKVGRRRGTRGHGTRGHGTWGRETRRRGTQELENLETRGRGTRGCAGAQWRDKQTTPDIFTEFVEYNFRWESNVCLLVHAQRLEEMIWLAYSWPIKNYEV